MLEKFEELKSIKTNLTCSQWQEKVLDSHEKDFERGLESPRVIGNYSAGLRENVEWSGDRDKKYYVDVAIAELTPEEVNRLRKESTPKIHDNPACPSGKCSEATINAIMNAKFLCKSGRTTEYTTTDRLVSPGGVEPPMFMKPPFFNKNGPVFWDVGVHNYVCKTCAEQNPSQSERKQLQEIEAPCQRCKKEPGIAASLYEERWCENCLCILNSRDKVFAQKGDSGAVIFEKKDGLQGFGIIFAEHLSTHQSCVIASPLQVALEALSKKERKSLRLVSKYGE